MRSHKLPIRIKNLSNGIYSCCLSEVFPKPFRDFRHRVDSEPIDLELCYDILDPFIKLVFDEGILVVKIG
jgi:hypothetical protein